MYTPITWAAPNKLRHLREKRSAERTHQLQEHNEVNNSLGIKQRVIELFNRPISIAKTVKLSLSS